jgi:hypothetical protein
VAVFDRALSAEELGKLAKLREMVSVAKAVR